MRKHVLLSAAVAALAILLTLTFVRGGRRAPIGADAATVAGVAGASASASDATAAAPSRPPGAPHPMPPAVAPSAIEGLATAERERDAHIARFEAAWARDRQGASSSGALQALTTAVEKGEMTRGARFSPTGVVPDCRETLCRVEAKFAPGTDGNEWATRLLLDMAGRVGTASTFTVPDGQGGSTVLLFAYRDGHAPARMP